VAMQQRGDMRGLEAGTLERAPDRIHYDRGRGSGLSHPSAHQGDATDALLPMGADAVKGVIGPQPGPRLVPAASTERTYVRRRRRDRRSEPQAWRIKKIPNPGGSPLYYDQEAR